MLQVRSVKKNKNKSFYITFVYSFNVLSYFMWVWVSDIFFFSPKIFLQYFLEGTFNVGRKFPQFLFDWESISPSLFKDNHRILDWWDFFPPNTFNSSLHCPFVYSFWEVGLYAYLFSFIGQLFFSPTSFRTFLSLCFSSCLKRYA